MHCIHGALDQLIEDVPMMVRHYKCMLEERGGEQSTRDRWKRDKCMEELKTRVGIQIQWLDVPLVGKWEGGEQGSLLTSNSSAAVGLSVGSFLRQVEMKCWKVSDHRSGCCSLGGSFWAMWYSALIAFMWKRGGFLSARAGKMKGMRQWEGETHIRHVTYISKTYPFQCM